MSWITKIFGKNMSDLDSNDIIEALNSHWKLMLNINSMKINCAQDIKRLNEISIDGNSSTIEKLLFFTRTVLSEKFLKTNIELRKSNIHGYGVFAQSFIKKGSIITFYPAHGIREVLNYYENDKILGTMEYSNNKFNTNDNYKLNITKNICIYGNPEKTSNKLLIGHMINDSANISTKSINEKDVKNSIGSYILKSNNNAEFKRNKNILIPYIIATKDINENDEILLSYSPTYWLNKEQTIIFNRLLEKDENFKEFIIKYGEKLR